MLCSPFLFITIACGACSGFHSIVASGTTCKQVRTERDVKPVGYGAMLLEAMVAIFALSCVMVLAPGTAAGTPDAIYAAGIGNFMHLCGVPMQFAVGFGLLAFSSFVFDTLDVCTRLGRYVLQEMTGLRGLAGGAVATLLTLAGPGPVPLDDAGPSRSRRSGSSSAPATSCSPPSRSSASASGSGARAGRCGSRSCPAAFMIASTGDGPRAQLPHVPRQVRREHEGPRSPT
jgi:hypothetical protein